MICVGNRIEMRAVERAVQIADGIEPLAMYLQAPPALVAAWMQGTRGLPPAAFLKIVEIIVDHGASSVRGVTSPWLEDTFKHREAANR